MERLDRVVSVVHLLELRDIHEVDAERVLEDLNDLWNDAPSGLLRVVELIVIVRLHLQQSDDEA